MKLSAAKPNKKKKPFIDNAELTIVVKQEKSKITGFDVRWKKKSKYFEVKRNNILSAWKEVEKFTKDIV